MIPPMAGTPGEECFYLNRLVAAPHGVLTAADAPSFGLALLGPAEIEAQLDLYLHPSEVPVAFEGSLNAVGATIDGFVDLFEITDGSDQLARAQQLRTDHGIEAAPVHVAASAGHWPFKPGEDAVALPDVTLMAEDTDITGVIAVVDTGLVQTGLPWLDPHVTIDDPIDIDPYIDSHAVGGHGTFIASLVRLIAPPTRVSMARARAVDPAKVTAHPEHPVPTDAIFSSELHVTEALARLLARHSEDPTPVHALNLSLGTYGCLLPDVSGQPIIPIPTMAGALQQWVVTHPNAAITAASGNEPFSTPFWPAALNQAFSGSAGLAELVSVEAADLAGDPVAWDQNGAKITDDNPWTNERAPGIDLIGVRGPVLPNPDIVWRWSGSSFASAVAAALVANGQTINNDYASIPGLSYLENGTKTTNTGFTPP